MARASTPSQTTSWSGQSSGYRLLKHLALACSRLCLKEWEGEETGRQRQRGRDALQKQEDSFKVTISTCEFFLCFTFHFDVLGKRWSFIEHLSEGEIQLRFDLSLLVLQTFAHRQTNLVYMLAHDPIFHHFILQWIACGFPFFSWSLGFCPFFPLFLECPLSCLFESLLPGSTQSATSLLACENLAQALPHPGCLPWFTLWHMLVCFHTPSLLSIEQHPDYF